MKRVVSGVAAGVLAAAIVGVPAPAWAAANRTPFGAKPWLVEDLNPGIGHANVQGNRVARVGDRLVFSSILPAHGHELWVSDGTSSGTRILRDEVTAAEPVYLLPYKGKVYYQAADASGDRELWVTDGTPAGTKRLKDLRVGGSGSPRLLTPYGDKFVMDVTNGAGTHELWISDGTAAGTHRAGAPTAHPLTTSLSALTVLGSKVIFGAGNSATGNEPWVWDGSAAAPVVLDVVGGSTGSNFLSSGGAAVMGGRLYATAMTGTHGTELWRTDGTMAGTRLVRDIRPGVSSGSPSALMALGGLVYFAADNGMDGLEPWVSDGTTGGTVMLRDINPGPTGSAAFPAAVFDGRVWFRADDGVHGSELWSSAGSVSSTRMLKDVATESGVSGVGSSDFLVHGGRLWFGGDDQHTGGIGDHGQELWSTDGSAAGTRMAADLNAGVGSSFPELHVGVGGTLFMSAREDAHGSELWAFTTRTSRTTAMPKSTYSRSAGLTKNVVVPVKVTASGTTPTGRVTIRRNGVAWGTATVVGGMAKVRLTRVLGRGSWTGFRAYHSGSVRSRSSTSAAFTVRVL